MRELWQRFLKQPGDVQAFTVILVIFLPPIGLLLWTLALYVLTNFIKWMVG